MSGLASFEKKINPLAKYDPLSASNLFKKKDPAAPPAAPPPPIIPISETGRDTVMASKDFAAAQKKRKGLLSTHTGTAGETMSGTSYQSSFGVRSLLGAGP